jgi:ferredoxin
MATVITEECINCGACEPECPNTAIYQGGVEYDWQSAKHAALSEEFFYIVPEKCTECVGFFDYEACAAVCPVDCCIPDPARPETEAVLLDRARELHPDKQFADDAPSRFSKSEAPAAADAPAAEAGVAAAAAPVAAPAGAPAVAAMPVFDPADFDVPILCRSCDGNYAVAFQHLSPGKILRCPHCGVSFNPGQRMYLAIAKRLDAYADRLNVEIDRHNLQVELEQILFEENIGDIRTATEREVGRLVLEATEPPKKSIFG